MNYISLKKWAAAIVCVCAIGLSFQVSAIPLTIGDAYYLGDVNPGIPAGESDEEGYINQLVSMAAPSGPTVVGANTFTRSANVFAGLPAADFTSKEDTGTITTFTLDGTTAYVLAKYDQDQAGALVWYVAGLVGEITIPATYNNRDISHTSFFGGGPGTVPDGGATIALLGFALIGVDVLRRKISRS